MTLRVFLALLIALTLIVSFALSLFSNEILSSLSLDLTGSLAFLEWLTGPLSVPTVVSVGTGVLVALVFFLIVNLLIVHPLKKIHAALEAFATRSERITLPLFSASPREIKQLAHEMNAFVRRVEESHARDQEVSRVKSDFISTAAHQLRTPLTGIRWALEALQKEPLTDSQKLLVTSAVDKSHDLVGIVGTLLDISSIESGKYKYQLATIDLSVLVSEVAADFITLAERSGVILNYMPVTGIPQVRIDTERMKWVLNNLIENAVRYTPSGGSVTITIETVAGRVIVKVRDTGIGIRAEDRNNIFERFYRAGNAVTKQNQGNGLGLYIARSIVKDHNGELSFEANTDGPGTTFILALPEARR